MSAPRPDTLLKPLVDIEKAFFDILVAKPAGTLGQTAPPRLPGPAELAANILSGAPIPGIGNSLGTRARADETPPAKTASRAFQ